MKPALKESATIDQNILDILLKNLPDLVFIKDSTGKYIQCNDAFCQFVGMKRNDIIGATDYDLFSKEAADLFRHHDAEMLKSGSSKRNEEWVVYPDGSKVLLDTLKTPYSFNEFNESGVLGVSRDITLLKKAEYQASLSLRRYESVLNNSKDGFWFVNSEGKIMEVNDSYCHYSGYSRNEVIGMSVDDIDCHGSDDGIRRYELSIVDNKSHIFESLHRKKNGERWHVEISISYSEAECFFAFIRDISERKILDEINSLRFKLSEMIFQDDLHQMLREAVDTAERLTDSQMGFYHFIEEDEENVSIQTWSTRTLEEMCYAKGEGMHYPVSEAGVWVDCIHKKKPVIHNDYPSLRHKKGMPEGHPKLIRELTVPLFRNGRVVSVIGLGNKETEYTDNDVAIVEQIANLCFEYSERKRTEQQIQFMAYNDILTRLPNRQLFSDRLSQSISHSKRSGETIAICYLDLDGFKPINDQYGHDVGDALLINFSQRLKNELREEDTLARIGGDEFAIILNGLADVSDAEYAVQRVLSCIASSPFEINEKRLHISASLGFTCYPQDNSDGDTLLRNADQAMYHAKNSGKNTFYLYMPVRNYLQVEHDKSVDEFKNALSKHQLVLYFQPRIDLSNAKLAGVEALVRWKHPEKGLLLPELFLPFIQGNPLEIELDEWVITNALDQHMAWRKQGVCIPVSVNVTSSNMQREGFSDYLRQVLEKYPEGISEYLELEVLETSAFADIETVSKLMSECSELGIQFSLDDFGTGYSSLTYFHRLPIQTLKIDQNFVRNMLKSCEDQRIVEGVIQLAKSIDRPVVAEGVSSKELGYMLYQLGCQYAQGFGVAQPMPERELLLWLSKWEQEDFWKDISEYTSELSSAYDINVAVFTLKEWLKNIKKNFSYETCKYHSGKEEYSDSFVEWYHGIGFSKYGKRPQFPFLLAKYNALLKLSDAIKNDVLTGKLYDEKILRLEGMVDELIELLGRLKT